MSKPSLGSDEYYSNSDIQILHEIVKAAQYLLDTLSPSECIPTSALFRAYDEILPAHGIDPDDDHHFSRILFRIGGERGDEPLIKKFEIVLDRMGIQIIFDDVTGAVTTEYPLRARRQSLTTVPEEQTHQIQAEESSYENGTAQTTASPQIPEISHSSPDVTQEFAAAKPVGDAPARPPYEMPRTATWLMEARRQMRDLGIDNDDADETSGNSKESKHDQEQEEIGDKEAGYENVEDPYEPTVPVHINNDNRPKTSHMQKTPSVIATQYAPTSRRITHYSPSEHTTIGCDPVFEHVAARAIPAPSPTQTTQPSHVLRRLDANLDEMEARAQLAYDFYLVTNATRLFRWWRDKAKSWPATEDYYEAMAMTEQRRCTMQITIMQWQDQAFFLKKQRIEEAKAAQKQQEYVKIERVATRAGQIYQITNNFVIWLAHSKVEAERIAVARRHILRKRHFDGWKKLTLGYLAMSHRFVLTINFKRWAEFSHETARKESKADVLCSSRVANMTLREWKREYRERLAEEHQNSNIRRRVMGQWLEVTESNMAYESRLEHKYQIAIARNIISAWHGLSDLRLKRLNRGSHLMAYYQASSFFRIWGAIDVEADLQRTYDGKLTMDALRDWNLEAKCCWMQNSSRHKLRSVAFRDWNLLQRMTAFQRRRDQNLKEALFSSLLSCTRILTDMNSKSSMTKAARQASHTVLETHLYNWAAVSCTLSRTEARVSRREAIDTMSDCLLQWKQASRCQPEMRRWSNRGEYFLTTSCYFLSWVERSKEVRKERLAAAFTKGRALQKERLVQRCWKLWGESSQRGNAQTHRCKVAQRRHNRYLVSRSLETWLSACFWLGEIEESVEVNGAEKMFSSMLSLWLDQADVRNNNDSTSWAIWAHQVVTEAWEYWDLAVEAVEEKQANAPRREKKRISKLVHQEFLAWLETANKNMTSSLATNEQHLWVHTPAPQPMSSTAPNSIARFSTRSQPVVSHAASRPTSELHEIMANTPTRRMGLARSVAALSSTTPSMALSTPYERELRAIYHGGGHGEQEPRATGPGLYTQSAGLLPVQSQPLRIALFQSRRPTRALGDLDEELLEEDGT
ncbi:regulator of (H+)-ATPase in vacuolar membrane [Ceratocystis pirilliformis]|uniref:Regulator of (H+)-ATPase in vacuolar membrane n=1 Tax=Ceratocystis pirilliformis TaxID=259994 RepID=A0ABR3ZAF7_9PEZI